MERIIQGRSATFSQTFFVDGVATDPSPDAATVGIVAVDGTVVQAPTAATNAGTGIAAYTVTPTQTALLDTWTVTWTAVFGGQTQTYRTIVEVAGDVLFSVAEARARAPLSSTTTYPTASIVEARTLAEQELEDAVGVAFVPRYARESFTAYGQRIRLANPRVRTIRSVSIDGTAMGAGDLAGLYVDATGLLLSISGTTYWGMGSRIVVAYEHGYDFPPQAASVAALDLARNRLLEDAGSSVVDPRAESIVTVDGTVRLSPAYGQFGLPRVDAFVAAHREAMIA